MRTARRTARRRVKNQYIVDNGYFIFSTTTMQKEKKETIKAKLLKIHKNIQNKLKEVENA